MQDMRNRSWRRFQRKKAINRAFLRYVKTEPDYRPSRKSIIKSITAPTGRCQNPFCCGNPRRIGCKTIQERRFQCSKMEEWTE